MALVGRPNAGKSTLLNRFVGEHLSIVAPKAQTTWQRVTGIATEGRHQLVFLDTPGLLDAKDLLQRAMLGAALEALAEADVVALVLDGSEMPSGREERHLLAALEEVGAPVMVVLNKADLGREDALEAWERWALGELSSTGGVHRVSAATGEGVPELRRDLENALPEGPFLYPPDEIAAAPVRTFVAELVRESVFELYHQEIPYSVFCQVGDFRESQDPVYIQVDLFVERRSQKGIVVGKGGAAIKELGARSREKIEHFLGARVYLDLWVKPLESWRKKRVHLGRLGFRLPPDDESSAP